MNSNEVSATSKKKASKELKNNNVQKPQSPKSSSTIPEMISKSTEQNSKEKVRSSTPIAPTLGSITQTRPKKAKSTIPTQSQIILKEKQDSPNTENIEESTMKPLDIPPSIKEEGQEIQEKQSFKPKGGIAMFQSKELFQAISMRQTNQNSTIRDNLKRIGEQIKEPPQEEKIENHEIKTSKSSEEPQTPRSPSISDRHVYVSWAPSDVDLSEEPSTIERKSPITLSKDNNTTAEKTISTTITEASSWKNTEELLKTDITPERTYAKAVDELKKASLTLTTSSISPHHESETLETKNSVSNTYSRSPVINRKSNELAYQVAKKSGYEITKLSTELESRDTGLYSSEISTRTLLVPNDLCFVVSDTTHKIHIDTLNMEEGILTREMHRDPSNYHVEYLEAEEGSKLPFVKKLYKILGNTWFCAMRINLDEKSIAINGVYILVANPQEIYVCIGTNKNVKKQEYSYDLARNQFVAIDYPKAVVDTIGLTSPLFWQYVDIPPPPFITNPTFRPVSGDDIGFDETDESERTFITRARLFGWRRWFEDGSEEEVFESPFSIACMNVYSILVLVTRKDVYIWFETLDIHKRPAVVSKVYQFAKKIFNDVARPEFSSIVICSSNGEPFHFRKFFVDWPCETMVSKEIYRLIGTFATELEHDLPRLSSIESEQKKKPVETRIIQQMWHATSNETSELVPYEQMDILFSGAIYIFVVQVTKDTQSPESDSTWKRYYRWTGMLAFLQLEEKKHEKYLPPAFSGIEAVDVEEGQEPKEFMNLFPNGFVCMLGPHKDMLFMPKPFPSDAMRVIQVSSYQSGIIRAFQISFNGEFDNEKVSKSEKYGTSWSMFLSILHNSQKSRDKDESIPSITLSSIFCYIFELSKKIYVWTGVGSWDSERSFTRSLAERLAKLELDPELIGVACKNIVMVNQFQEPLHFFEDIQIKIGNVYPSNMIAVHRRELEHVTSTDEQEPLKKTVYSTSIPKVFRFRLKSRDDGTVTDDISDIEFEKMNLPIQAVNLQTESIYLHDIGDEWILWIGSKTRFNYRQMRFIYISTTVLSRHFPSTLPTNRSIMITCDGYESQAFKAGVIGWNYREIVFDNSSTKVKKNWFSKLITCSCIDEEIEDSHYVKKGKDIISLPLITMMQRPRSNFYSYKDLKKIREYHIYAAGPIIDTISPKSVHFMEKEPTQPAE